MSMQPNDHLVEIAVEGDFSEGIPTVVAESDQRYITVNLPALERSEIHNAIFVTDNTSVLPRYSRVMQIRNSSRYSASCDDFGPSNALSIIRFVEGLDREIDLDESENIVYDVGNSKHDLTHAIFLVGAYLILKLKQPPVHVCNLFCGLDKSLVELHKTKTSTPDVELEMIDYWQGLRRGIDMGWLTLPSSLCPGWGRWGRIYKDEYSHFDNPFNGDLHEVVPGKLVAFKEPKDLGSNKFLNDKVNGVRTFSPLFYVDVFRMLGVNTVIQLSEDRYDASSFQENGISHFDLQIEDEKTPPAAIIAEFFRIVDNADGLVAVHCQTGLGKTGTLIALYIMRTCGFSAREAIGWLRIMRPGSVAGHQQALLHRIEAAVTVLVPASLAPSSACEIRRTQSDGYPTMTQSQEKRSCLRQGNQQTSSVPRRSSVTWAGVEGNLKSVDGPRSPVLRRGSASVNSSPKSGGSPLGASGRRKPVPAGVSDSNPQASSGGASPGSASVGSGDSSPKSSAWLGGLGGSLSLKSALAFVAGNGGSSPKSALAHRPQRVSSSFL